MLMGRLFQENLADVENNVVTALAFVAAGLRGQKCCLRQSLAATSSCQTQSSRCRCNNVTLDHDKNI